MKYYMDRNHTPARTLLVYKSFCEAVDRAFSARKEDLALLKQHLQGATNKMKQRADLQRSDWSFKWDGQWVFIKLQLYRQISAASRSSRKLAPKYFNPYKVSQIVRLVAYKLELPPESRIHSSFHVSYLNYTLIH